MSTIASPRPSSSIRSPSSTRNSLEGSTRPPPATRRNRAALRDYYGLKAASKDADANISEELHLGPEEGETLTELDSANFNADAYVNSILASSGLSGVLKVEADLVSQIRNLDSDRKSLVYDNYSKLLSATSTIRRMRTNMDPLAPTTHTLAPAISHIAETAASLSSSMHATHEGPKGLGIHIQVEGEDAGRKQRETDTVRWVLDTPRRLRELINGGKEEEAQREWDEISRILGRWEGVAGVSELRHECQEVLQEDESL